MEGKRATISDIAMAAGVSKTTVSRFINGRRDLISPTTRTRIEWAIDKARYRPSSAARSLKTGASGIVGVIVDIGGEGVVEAFVRGVQEGISSLDDPRLREAVPLVAFAREDGDAARLLARFEDLRAVRVILISMRTPPAPRAHPHGPGDLIICGPSPQADIVMRKGADPVRCGREAARAHLE